ncbi:hypothetical protein GIB67_005958 [Kingdonia uniflora]|uniref:Pentatricopeptide repeat-containing protein n=1 Tax=Kingdonia uniflora TaxID=39325 RepID=A0A7J7MBZ5_9MAGN|nr:hypothetical protein GIB67_005958 [Kingdonia uniflora]
MGYFTLLSNAYASADGWVDVASVRQKMVEMGVKKPPGHSQIQVNGVIHYFVAGDWMHKDVYAIHEVVGKITMQIILELPFV